MICFKEGGICIVKVLLLNFFRIIDAKGGAEKVFTSMGNTLYEKGHEVILVAFENKEGIPFYPVSEGVEFINVGVGYTGQQSLMDKIKRGFCGSRECRHIFDNRLDDIKRAKLISPVIEKYRPDIIISFNIRATRILMNNVTLTCPVITMFHGDPELYFKELNYDQYSLKSLERCECLQVLMPSFVDSVKKYIVHNNVVYIPNAISQNDCAILEEKRNVVITVARIEPKQKRQHLLIEAFNLLKWNYPDWKVEIWGENYVNKEYYNYCLELVNKYNLREKISFCGTTDNVDEKLRNASIFAFPSCSEGFSLALGEAMAAGLPSVGFKNCPAVNELIKNGSNGILCEETVEDFARGLVELMDDADKRKRYGSQAKEDMKQYMPEKVWDKWEELINKTVSDYKKK